ESFVVKQLQSLCRVIPAEGNTVAVAHFGAGFALFEAQPHRASAREHFAVEIAGGASAPGGFRVEIAGGPSGQVQPFAPVWVDTDANRLLTVLRVDIAFPQVRGF